MKNAPWTEEEIALLTRIAPTHTIRELLVLMPNRSEGAILGKAGRLGVPVKHIIKPNAWTPTEDQYLRDKWTTTRVKAMADHLGRTQTAVRRRASLLELKREKRITEASWSREENSMLRVGYGIKSTKEMAKRMGRSVGAIHRQARNLGLATPCEKRPWAPEDDKALRLAAGRKNSTQIAKEMGRSRGAVCARARGLGLSLRTRLLNLTTLETLLNPVDGEPWFNQHTFRQWRLAGLSCHRSGKKQGPALTSAAMLRNFWKERPEAVDIYALDEATLDEFDIDLDSWPEPPNFKVIGCTGRKGTPHRLTLNSFDLYSTSNWCTCGNHLPMWAHGYSNEEIQPASCVSPALDKGVPERSIFTGVAPRRRHAQRTQPEPEGALAQAPDTQSRGRGAGPELRLEVPGR